MAQKILLASLLAVSASLFAAEASKTAEPVLAKLNDTTQGWKSPDFPAACRFTVAAVKGVAAAPPEVVTAFRKTFSEGASQLPEVGEQIKLSLNVKGWKKSWAGSFLPSGTRVTSTVEIQGTLNDKVVGVWEIEAKSKDGDGGLTPNDGEICASKSWVTLRSTLGI